MSVAKENRNALACEKAKRNGGRVRKEGGCGGQQIEAESEGRR